jgi:hypothetical protein
MKNWKQSVFFGMVAIIALSFGFVGCDDGNEQTYTVTIGSLTNGLITANPTSGIAGTEITLNVSPDNLYRLKVGTLKHGATVINETTLKFNLPSADVIVTAQFESKFVGTWVTELAKFIITENTIIIQVSDGDFTAKGTWVTEPPNKFVETMTHVGRASTVEGIPLIDEPIVQERTFEFITDSMLKLTLNGNEMTFALLE